MSEKHMPQWTSVLCACLPAFWAAAVTCRVLRALPLGLDEGSKHVALLLQTPRLANSVQRCHGNISCTATWFNCPDVIGNSFHSFARNQFWEVLFVGWLVALLATYILYRCIVWNIPATMINLIVAGRSRRCCWCFHSSRNPILAISHWSYSSDHPLLHEWMDSWYWIHHWCSLLLGK